jgi:hypothetical protein
MAARLAVYFWGRYGLFHVIAVDKIPAAKTGTSWLSPRGVGMTAGKLNCCSPVVWVTSASFTQG